MLLAERHTRSQHAQELNKMSSIRVSLTSTTTTCVSNRIVLEELWRRGGATFSCVRPPPSLYSEFPTIITRALVGDLWWSTFARINSYGAFLQNADIFGCLAQPARRTCSLRWGVSAPQLCRSFACRFNFSAGKFREQT